MNENNSNNQRELDHRAKLAQFSELNQRIRVYSNRFWQIPFAYIGLTGLALINVSDKCTSHLNFVLAVSSIFGILVFLLMYGIKGAIETARNAIKKLEEELNLDVTVKKRPLIIWTNLLIIILSVFFYLWILFCQ